MPLSLWRHAHPCGLSEVACPAANSSRISKAGARRSSRCRGAEEEMRLLARDRGVQIARWYKWLKIWPAAAAQSDVARRSATSLIAVAEEAGA